MPLELFNFIRRNSVNENDGYNGRFEPCYEKYAVQRLTFSTNETK